MSAQAPVLILGGCGFVGYHITRHFLSSTDFGPIHVGSRSPSKNKLARVTYHPVDITSREQIDTLVSKTKAKIVVNAACPSPTAGTTKLYRAVTVHGTTNILAAAKASPYTQAFIFTSSATIAKGREHLDLKEACALADEDRGSHPYAVTKAQADKLVCAVNHSPNDEVIRYRDLTGYLSTAYLRLPIVYGERDDRSVVGALEALDKGQTNFQIGDGRNLWDFCSADNAGRAHVRLARVLLSNEGSRAAGEAFNITDGERQLFWDFARIIWRAAGWKEDKAVRIWIMPTWVALIVAHILKWIFWVGSFGSRRPGLMGMQQVEYTCFTHTYSISKAREILGFKPVPEFEEGLRNSVDWAVKHQGWESRLHKSN